MNAHIRSVSSETVAEDANIHDAYENAEGHDEAPIGLPEEGGSSRNDGLGEAPPPLIAEREDRAVRARDANAETKKGVAKLVALAWRRQAKAPAPVAGEGNEGEPKEGAPDSAAEARRRDGEPGNPASVGDNHPVGDDSQGRDSAAVAAKAKRPILKRKGTLAAALAAGVAIPAIVVLNWPHSAPQPIVEPGMLADGQTKVMAPSAALATAPPREALNVSRDRPLVNETRRDELNEMLSFKAGDKAADGLTPKADAPAAVPAARLPIVAETHETAEAPSAHPTSERSAVAPSAPEATPPAPIDQPKSADATRTPASHPAMPLFLAPTPGAVARDPASLTAALPPEPGLGGAAKIEARLADLETAVKDRSNEARARLEAEKAETHTLEKIAELGALVTRLTGQVKDLQDKVQTLSTGADEKFADLTRRVALGEANRAVASAENAGSPGLAAQAQAKGAADGSEAHERMRTKVAAADVAARSSKGPGSMQGLVDFASQIGEVFAVLLPTFAYLAALGCFLFAAWGFWMQAQPHNPFRGQPWIPFVSLLLSGAFASFDKILSMALASGGSSLSASITSLSSYSPPSVSDASTLMGSSPSATLVNVVTLFQGFFQSFGAMCAFFALLSWRAVINGHANRSQMGCVVQFVFGIMLINILAIANALIAMFVA